jgi:hypothetical protein
MKLPEFDNRTPNTPLYSSKETPPFETIKFLVFGIGLPLGIVACVLFVGYTLLSALFH